MKLGHEQRKAMSKFFISLAIFWLTTVPVSLLTDIGLTNNGWEVLGTVILGTVFAVIGIFVNKDEDKPKEVMRTEVKKGVFHVEKAEITK